MSIASPSAQRLLSFWRLMTLNRKVAIGAGIVGFFLLLAIAGPLFTHQDATVISIDILEPPSSAHWLGTNQIGQDVFAQLVIGARASIALGFIAGTITTILSVAVGLISGYFGGWLDEVLSMLTNVFLVLPTLPLAILLAVYLPFNGTLTLGIVIVVTGWSWGARVMRAQTLSMCSREYVDTARSQGESSWRIIFYEIFPNEIALVAAELLGTVIYSILAETGLEYLGLGDISGVSWGTMLFLAQNGDALLLGAWWWFLPPGLCIALLGAGLALLNFGIDEVANPRLRKESTSKLKRGKMMLKLRRRSALKEEAA
ncbi:MAG TPA: ABC transporter permease [Ktedonobacterales bacterium]|nr:ABC transporter permease [Ktedonobacterales bacterium]